MCHSADLRCPQCHDIVLLNITPEIGSGERVVRMICQNCFIETAVLIDAHSGKRMIDALAHIEKGLDHSPIPLRYRMKRMARSLCMLIFGRHPNERAIRMKAIIQTVKFVDNLHKRHNEDPIELSDYGFSCKEAHMAHNLYNKNRAVMKET